MSFQLIFTSTPRGLTLGRSGFCTVARHREMSDSLVTALERCSAYERSESPGTELPVIHAYRIFRIGSSSFHVLTRIQDSGVDYTQRGNHLAQHLVFLPGELAAAPTPADIFLYWDGWIDNWNEAPRYLSPAEQPSLGSISSSIKLPAQTWQHRTGDAAHAALLAQPDFRNRAILTASTLPTNQVLHLIGESLLLIQTEESGLPGPWNIPFTTHLQSHDLEEDFSWRFEEAPDPALISSRCGSPVLSLDAASWPPVTDPALAVLAREGGFTKVKLKDTARLPDLSSLNKSDDTSSQIPKRTPSVFPAAPARSAEPKNAWLLPSVAGIFILLILVSAWFLTRSSPATPSLTAQIVSLQTPAQREALRQFLREHPVPSGEPENDRALEKAALWLEASDYLENLQFLRRQEDKTGLQETLIRVQNLPQLPDLKLTLPALGYEMKEAQDSLAAIPSPSSEPPAEVIPSNPQPSPEIPKSGSYSLAHFFGPKPAILTTLYPEQNIIISQFPAATEWMGAQEKNTGRFVRVSPLESLPLSEGGLMAKPQPGRNRSDPVRFYQGVHLLFESKKIGDLDGSESLEISFARDFDSVCPAGTFGRVLQFEDASGLVFSIFVLKEGTSTPLLRLPRSMIDLDSSTQSYGLRQEFFQGSSLLLANHGKASMGGTAVSLKDPGSWADLKGPAGKAIPETITLELKFSGGTEDKNIFPLAVFEGEAAP